MCGTLKYEHVSDLVNGIVVKPNQHVEVRTDNGALAAIPWYGHIREENTPPTLRHRRVKLEVKEYTEKGIAFKVPEGLAIDAYQIFSTNYPKGSGLFIVTRDATPTELTRCKHPRHPKFVTK